MKTLEKILEKDAIVLEEGQLYACLGGSDNTSGTTTSYTERTGETCTSVTTDIFDSQGNLTSMCTEHSCCKQ